ncbi:MAG: ATP-dependent RNA helicase DbpA [Agarilytica sp.]
MSDSAFSQLKLPEAQLKNLTDLGYHSMTPIQAQSLPLALAGDDLIAQAKTGSGKTAAFAIPALMKLNQRYFGAQTLVLCPTRELATQVADEFRRLARYQNNIKVVVLCGGQSIGPQIGSLEHGAHIVVGTPGRIKDHLRKNTLSLDQISTLVLDEADRMLDMGFIEDIESIIAQTPSSRQTLLFSATYPTNIQTLSDQFQRDPKVVKVESVHTNSKITQSFYICDSQKGKKEALARVLSSHLPEYAVVFCNTKQMTQDLSDYLGQRGTSTSALHGDLEQKDRDKILIQFKQQSCRVLVATDVAARGLDIDDLPVVINFDLPHDPEIYVHRIGRTGRADKTGLAVSLFTGGDHAKISAIEEYQAQSINFEPASSLPPAEQSLPAPVYATLCISGGRKDKVRPGDILGALTGDAGIDGSSVGKIDILPFVAFVAIKQKDAKKALNRLNNGKIKGRNFRVRIV